MAMGKKNHFYSYFAYLKNIILDSLRLIEKLTDTTILGIIRKFDDKNYSFDAFSEK